MVDRRNDIDYDLEECGRLCENPLRQVMKKLDSIPCFLPDSMDRESICF